jgi:hypothetical protein
VRMLFPMLRNLSIAMIGAWSVVSLFAASPQLSPTDVQTVIQRSVAANRLDWSAAPQYSYFERDRQGKGSKTYEVVMIQGSPYRRLVALNKAPLSPADQDKEGRLMKDAIAKRRAESREERVARTAEYEKERNRDRSLMDQLVEAFDFRSLGQQKLGNRDVYLLRATPRPGYRPPNIETEVLTGMRGTLWIDKDSFQWVKVAADVVHPVFIAGFLARVEPGTRFELEKAPVAEGVWLPTHCAMKSRAKILFVLTHRENEDETYFDYHKANSILRDIP